MSVRTRRLLRIAMTVALFALAARAEADAVLLLAAPYGRTAGFNPTGHVGVYLTRVCADSPTVLRRCREGETGAVVSRYNKVADLDWAAIPLIPYLYGVQQATDVPTEVTPALVRALRETYRRSQLRELIPDTVAVTDARWVQLVGAAYDRQFVAVSVRTTPEQDDGLIAAFNARENRHRFNLLFRNCADFARDLINDHYYPGALRSNRIGDLGLTTPKQVAKALARFGSRRPETKLTAYVIPQVPGLRPKSGPTRGVLESLLKVKKYSVPLAIVQPWVPVGLAAGYLTTGRFNPHRLASYAVEPDGLEREALLAAVALDHPPVE